MLVRLRPLVLALLVALGVVLGATASGAAFAADDAAGGPIASVETTAAAGAKAIRSAAADAADALDGAVYRIGPGDVLAIRVLGEDDLSGKFSVSPEGVVNLPMVGSVPAGGNTAQQFAGILKGLLARDYLVDPQVDVKVEGFASRPVQVLGAVRRPGTYFLSGPTRLLEIISLAGGVLNDKSSAEVRISRDNGGEPQIVDLDQLLSHGEGNVHLRAGDLVNVLEGKVIYVNGEVHHPGAVPWRGGITVSRALALAGGAKGTANLRHAYILREGETLPISLKRIFKAKDKDIVLRPGDQLLVEVNPF
jgi:polysaccharide biosynthesis/export protein